MTARTPTELKALFETGDSLLQTSFADVFDSYINTVVSGAQTIQSDLRINGELVADRVSASSIFFGTVSANSINVGTISAASITAATISGTTVTVSTGVFGSVTIANSRITNTVDVSARPTGTTQASAKSLSNTINLLVAVSAGTNDAFVLPGGYPGYSQWLINTASATAQLFPPSGGTIDGGSTNAAQLINPNARVGVFHATSALFYTLRGV